MPTGAHGRFKHDIVGRRVGAHKQRGAHRHCCFVGVRAGVDVRSRAVDAAGGAAAGAVVYVGGRGGGLAAGAGAISGVGGESGGGG